MLCHGSIADIDECALDTDNCDTVNAVCHNNVGSFDCTCNGGYEGDGVTCTGNKQKMHIPFSQPTQLGILAARFECKIFKQCLLNQNKIQIIRQKHVRNLKCALLVLILYRMSSVKLPLPIITAVVIHGFAGRIGTTDPNG